MLKELVEAFEKNKITYQIVAGFGIDALRGTLSKVHNDVDMLVLRKDYSKIKLIIEKLGYSGEIVVGRFKISRKDGAKADLEMITIVGNEIVIEGKVKTTKIPLELFKKNQKVSLNGVSLNVSSNEILKLFAIYDRKSNALEFMNKFLINQELFDKITRS